MTKQARDVHLRALTQEIIPILKRNDVVRAGMFGSVVRGEATKSSDIDILIEFKGNKSLLDLVGLKLDLEKKLNKKVDVLTYHSLHPLLRDTILKEEVRIYEER
ncbi:MAG: nucleotidyltransferase family protein [Candidatus Aenigmarchaeota archaeon]|nr:nucleotidyltransferase family protein [Candidatus Aenigmarchaeota archaeon]